MDFWQAVTAIILPIVTVAGFTLSVVWNSARHRKTEIHEAEERGKMIQRITEAEDDIQGAHDKIRNLQGGVAVIEQTQAAQSERLAGVIESNTRIETKLDRLIQWHMKGGDK